MKPAIRAKRKVGSNCESIEVFRYNHGVVLHKHLLTKDAAEAKLYGVHRKFWDSYYCWQELMLRDDEVRFMAKEILRQKNSLYKKESDLWQNLNL